MDALTTASKSSLLGDLCLRFWFSLKSEGPAAGATVKLNGVALTCSSLDGADSADRALEGVVLMGELGGLEGFMDAVRVGDFVVTDRGTITTGKANPLSCGTMLNV
jgi:hypothetical protein